MNQLNAIVDCNVRNLHNFLHTLQAFEGCEFVAAVYNAPDDVTDLVLRVSTAHGHGFYDFPASRSPNGDWIVRILPMAFRESGVEWYELRAKAADGHDTALGRGKVLVGPWSVGTAETLDANRRFVMTIADEQGAQHPIYAVKNDIGEWTYQFASALDPELEAIEVDKLVSVSADTTGDETVLGVNGNGN